MLLPVVPYADVVVTDRAFRDLILRADPVLDGRVVATAAEAVQLLEPWISS